MEKKRCCSSYLEDDDHVTVMLLNTFTICSTVLICANSYENTLSAKEIIEAKWYCRIFNLDRFILFCPLLTFYTPTSIYMHILHTFLQVLTRRICSTIRNFFFSDHILYSHDLVYCSNCRTPVVPGFFCLLLDVGKIGILINKRYIMYYFNFSLSKDFLLFDDVFLLQAKKIRV